MQPFIRVIRPTGILSFAPDCEPISLNPLNVLIGPNGSGKSNLMELFELLRAAATDLAGAIRDGGGVGEWLWKGEKKTEAGIVNTEIELPNFDTLFVTCWSSTRQGRDLRFFTGSHPCRAQATCGRSH